MPRSFDSPLPIDAVLDDEGRAELSAAPEILGRVRDMLQAAGLAA